MKMVTTYIDPASLNRVKEILYDKKINRFSVSDAWGHSDEPGYVESYRGVEMEIDLLKKIRIDAAVNDNFVDILVKSLIDEAKAGGIGDGKIFVLPIEDCYRLSSGEQGSTAIG